MDDIPGNLTTTSWLGQLKEMTASQTAVTKEARDAR